MPIRLRHQGSYDNNTDETTDPVMTETTVDGMSLAWGPNQERSLADDGVALNHATFMAGAGARVFENNSLVTSVRVDSFPSRS